MRDDRAKSEPIDMMYFCRPMFIGSSVFGSLHFYFDPTEIQPGDIEKLGKQVADLIDDYWFHRHQRNRELS